MNFTKQLSIIVCLFFCQLTVLVAQETQLLRVLAQQGDGVYALLRRYQLDKKQCNFDFFYQKNKLKQDDYLIAGRAYDLPIFVYNYDAVSIRSTININDWSKARRIQQFNEELLTTNLRPTDYRADNILWVPAHELNCATVSSIKKPKKVGISRSYAIFGDKYAEVSLESKALSGAIFYIVGGHGGRDPGAIGHKDGHKLCEDEYAYDVSLRLARNILKHGGLAYVITRDADDGVRDDIFMPCDQDEYCWGSRFMYRGHKKRLEQRANAINKLYLANKQRAVPHQRAVMIHIDSRNQSQSADMFFYHVPGKGEGRNLAYTMYRTIKEMYNQHRKGRGYSGTVSGRDLFMLRETFPPALYIELGNIANAYDQRRILLAKNRQTIADWLCEGLIRDYKRQTR